MPELIDNLACPSRRFERPAAPFVVENLAALWARDAAVAAAVERVGESVGHLRVTTAKNGEPTLVATVGGRGVQQHSRYDPSGEARAFAAKFAKRDDPACFVFGFGLGYHVEAILDVLPSTTKLWIVEPDVSTIALAARHRDLTTLFDNSRVGFVTSFDDRAALYERFSPLSGFLSAGTLVVEHAPSVERDTHFFEQARGWIDEIRTHARTAVNTLVMNSKKTLENIARNLPWYAGRPGIGELKDAYKGRPAIIVSAGPSLRKNRHLLKDAVGRCAIIAVQTTLRPLLDLGVEPDFVTSLDYSEISARFFHDLPRGLKTRLVLEPKATDAIASLHAGPLCVAGSETADRLLGKLKLDRPRLRAGATVAHLSFYLAEYLGCDPILFIGQDLGFSDGLCYAPGTSYDDVWRPELNRFNTIEMKQWEQIARERPILRRIPDYQGRPMYTEHRLFSYLQQFERDFANSKSRVIDATEGGAMKRGAEVMTLADALARFATEPLPPLPASEKPAFDSAAIVAELEARIGEALEMRRIAEQVVPLLEEVRDHLTDSARVNRAIGRIDPLRQQMNALGRSFDLIMQIAQRDEFEKFRTDLAIEGDARATPDERQRRRADRDLKNAAAIVEATHAFERLMRDAIERVRAFATREAA